ncbi:MAG: ribokinase [Bacteroidetes bacterium]|nr:ribokinase [Bacteroidota bacterium]MBS1932731.1 ribokinase [Bacteroidota bacterium]
MYDICCIGHITFDKVVTEKNTVHMPGGTSFYFSVAIHNMDVRYLLITSLAQQEMHFVTDLRTKGIEVDVPVLSQHTVYFENTYSKNQDYRTQRVLRQADPFNVEQLPDIQSGYYHLGPLLTGDIPLSIIKSLSKKGKVSLDVQGFLRRVENKKVYSIDWAEKREALKYVHILKANESEMEVLTGCTDVREAAHILAEWGVKEIVITLGSRGSVIYDGAEFYEIPAYMPITTVVDATGCGDTYMAGYLYQRSKGAGYQQSGEFAAAMATLKIESSGPFTGTEEDVQDLLINSKREVFFGA